MQIARPIVNAALLAGIPLASAAEPGLFETLAARYAEIDTLRATVTQTHVTTGRDDRPASRLTQSWDYTIIFDRDADKLTITAPWHDIAHTEQGVVVTRHEPGLYHELSPEPLSFKSLDRGGSSQEYVSYLLQLPSLDLLIGDLTHPFSDSWKVETTGEPRQDSIDGAGATVYPAIRPYSNEPGYQLPQGPALTCPAEYWIDNDSDLIRRLKFDSTDASRIYNEALSGYDGRYGNIGKFEVIYDIDYQSINEPIEPSAFDISTEGLQEAPAATNALAQPPASTVDTIEKLPLSLSTWPAPVSAWFGKTIATPQGDAFFMPHDAGGFAKLDHATGTLSRVPMQGADPNRTILDFASVDDEQGGWFLVTDDAYDFGDIAFTRIDRDGTRRWSVPLGIDPATEPSYEVRAHAFDFDHDNADEFFIVAAVTNATDYQQSVYLVVLENNGKALYTKRLSLDSFGTTHLVESEDEPPALYIFGYDRFIRVTLDL
jgi:hypothetical protein